MRIFALLSYWDERPDHLGRCVRSLAGFCDYVIAVDGPYATFQPERLYGAESQIEAIAVAARQADVLPWFCWTLPMSEVEKRAAMFRYAREASATPDDWFIIIDADMELYEFTPEARAKLEASDRDVAEVRWHDLMINRMPASTHRFRSMFRALPGLTVERAHYLYTVPDGSALGRRFLWHQPNGQLSDEPILDLFGDVTLHHMNSQRDPARRQRALSYYADRDARSLESVGDWR